jgi:hypothetical protein
MRSNWIARGLKFAARLARALVQDPVLMRDAVSNAPAAVRGYRFADQAKFWPGSGETAVNELGAYFLAHDNGPGIFKWEHYFEIYHRHFQKFIGREVHILEIGVFSGGSLEMWRQYFGDRCRVYGVDIEEACRVYARPDVEIFIGDQADRSFWATVRQKVPRLDIVIDDGGHAFEQQVVSFEELLPHLSDGGVYLCEDTHGARNPFLAYVAGFASRLNGEDGSTLLKAIDSVHLYPSVAVIERTPHERKPLRSTWRGTEWQPFYGEPGTGEVGRPAPTVERWQNSAD